jgi:pimeloyl-ACP methyl ester carboxylesterase
MPTIVLVHGAFHGPCCFDPLVEELKHRGIECVAPELPLTSLADDVAAVRAVLDRADGPVTLLGHSYGGAVVTEAGNHPAVRQLILLAALAPDAGEPASGGPVQIGEAFLTALRPSADGRLEVDPDMAAAAFYPDVSPEVAADAVAKLRPGATGLRHERITAAAWRTTPCTYVVCADDPIVLPAAQRALAARCGATVRELPGDHSPFLARPAELADLLVESTGA